MLRPTAEGNARVDALIARCADLREDLAAQKKQLGLLKAMPDERASFAAALFELDRARRGDAEARAAMQEVADSLLHFWRDGRGESWAASHPALDEPWQRAARLLQSFDARRFTGALDACWAARGDATQLEQCLLALGPGDDRRAEFARCLYHLELARLGVQRSRAEFARRAALAHEAYLDDAAARELVGDDAGLQHLWSELVPYLDEFFESLEEARSKAGGAQREPTADELEETLSGEELVELPPPPPSLPNARVTAPLPAPSLPGARITAPEPAPHGAPTAPGPVPHDVHTAVTLRPGTRLEDLDVDLSLSATLRPGTRPESVGGGDPSLSATLPPDASPAGARRLRPPPLDQAVRAPALPPPPPPDDTLPPGDTLNPDELLELPPSAPGDSDLDLEVIEDFEPGPATQAFWRYTETCLALLPPADAPRLSARVLAAEDRQDRKKLTAWLDDVKTRFQEVPESRALQCLMRLYLAAHLKEKSLFGSRNEKREEGFVQALGLLSRDPSAAARAAVWFELDGPRTAEKLGEGLEVVWDFLQFCHRNRLDPLAPTSPRLFLR